MATKEEILEGNKLIADFMENPQVILPESLEYNSSWDWLMPVVEKISNYHYPQYWGNSHIPEDAGRWDDCAYLRTFGMRDGEGNFMVRFNANTLCKGVTLIEATWNAIVDFAKWQNSQEFNAEMKSYEKEGLLKIVPDEPKN